MSYDRIRRLATQYVRPHRVAIVVAFAGTLAQLLLLLPVPLLQGWVLDRILPLLLGSRDGIRATTNSATVMIVLSLAFMVACLVGRTVLGWAVAARMSRISFEVVREVTEAMHRKLQHLPMSSCDRHGSVSVWHWPAP